MCIRDSISNVSRSPDWIKESYELVANQDTYVTIGSEESKPVGVGWVNDTWVAFTEEMCPTPFTECWSNVTKVITSEVGATVAWRVCANDTSDNWAASDIYTYVTTPLDITPPTITFVSQTPSNLNESSIEPVTIIVNITDESGINLSKVAFFTGVNHTSTQDFYHYNWSWRYPSNDLQPDMRRADNRNMSYWFESVVFKESPDDIWTFAGYDNTTYEFEVIDEGSDYVTLNITFFSAQMMFPQIFPFDKMYLTAEDKTGQYVELHNNQWLKIKFYPKMLHNYTYENYTIYISLNIDPSFSPNTRPLEIYFCNASYTTGDPLDSDYCVYVEDIDATDTRTIVINQSSYIQNVFYIANGYIDGVKVSDEAYLVFRTTVPEAKAFRLYYADDEINQYINFTNFNHAWVSTDDGTTWNLVSYTPDFYLISTQGERDKVMYYVYACDIYDNCVNSSMQYDSLDPVNHAPAEPLITAPTENENVTGLYNITWLTIGDPDFDPFSATVYLCNPDGSINATLCDNISGDNQQYEYYCEIDSGMFQSGRYRINVTLCDIHGLCSSSLTPYNFTIYHTYETYQSSGVLVTDLGEKGLSTFKSLVSAISSALKSEGIGNIMRVIYTNPIVSVFIERIGNIGRVTTSKIVSTADTIRTLVINRAQYVDINVKSFGDRIIGLVRDVYSEIKLSKIAEKVVSIGKFASSEIVVTDYGLRTSVINRINYLGITTKVAFDRTVYLLRDVYSEIVVNVFGVGARTQFVSPVLNIVTNANAFKNVVAQKTSLISITVGYVAERVGSLIRDVYTVIKINDIVERLRSIEKFVSSPFGINVYGFRTIAGQRITHVYLNLKAIAERVGITTKTLDVSLIMKDVADRIMLAGRYASSKIVLNLYTMKGIVAQRVIPLTILIQENIVRMVELMRTAYTKIEITEIAKRVELMRRCLVSHIVTIERSLTTYALQRLIHVDIIVADVVTSVRSLAMDVYTSIKINEVAERVSHVIRTGSTILSLYVKGLHVYLIDVSQQIGLSSVVIKTASLVRNVFARIKTWIEIHVAAPVLYIFTLASPPYPILELFASKEFWIVVFAFIGFMTIMSIIYLQKIREKQISEA